MTVSELREELEYLSYQGYGESEVKILFRDIDPLNQGGVFVIKDIYVLNKCLSDGLECVYLDRTPETGGAQ